MSKGKVFRQVGSRTPLRCRLGSRISLPEFGVGAGTSRALPGRTAKGGCPHMSTAATQPLVHLTASYLHRYRLHAESQHLRYSPATGAHCWSVALVLEYFSRLSLAGRPALCLDSPRRAGTGRILGDIGA